MLYSDLLTLINNGCKITIISNNKNTNSEVAKLYFNLYHNSLYYDKISISKTIIINHSIRASIHGKIVKKEQMKQIHFVHINNLEKWMMETDERMDSVFKIDASKTNLPENKVLKKYKLYSKIMYKQRIIILLDNIKIPDKLNPSKSIINENEFDTLEHHEWKLYLTNLIKKYNELKSKYFVFNYTLHTKGRRTKTNNLLEYLNFKELTDEEKQIIHETDLNENNFDYVGNIKILKGFKSKYEENTINQNDKSDLEILQDRILNVYNLEPDINNPKYITKFDKINDIEKLRYPSYLEILISMDETLLLNQNYNKFISISNKQKYNSLLFNISVNGLPELVNYKSPNYLNKNAWKNINILKIDYMIIDSNYKILKQQFYYVANESIHNTVNFEVKNKISDEYRNEHGRTFIEIAEFIKNDINNYKIKFIISHGTDVNYNLLLLEYERNLLNLDIFKNIIVINTKQYLWKKDVTEKMESFDECKNCNSKIEMIHNLLKSRLKRL